MASSRQHQVSDTCWRSPVISAVSPEPDLTDLLSSSSSSNNSTENTICIVSTVPCVISTASCSASVTSCSTSVTSSSASVARCAALSGANIYTAVPPPSRFSINTVFGNTESKLMGFKPNSSAMFEHSVKGGKTAKRGKTISKLRILTFSDIEGSLSFFDRSSSSWPEALQEKSLDRQQHSNNHESGYTWSEETGGGAGKRTKICHPSTHTMTSWDIDGGLAADFDGSLSGLGTELGTSSYNMSEALLALPVFKQENLENGFQYILGAATSPAVKMNEETLTYLNQGQSYEIKVKKLGDLSELQGKCLRSIVRVQFHERRLQYMEREQIEQWKQARPGERILDVDIPLSYGLVDVNLDPSKIHQVEFIWDPTKETGLYFRVHAISTEFTAKKHGGEKGVPFRIQIETYSHGDDSKLLHAASCQIKVFKPKGADRKHKTDREKMEKRTEAEKEKYQPSYECTVLTEVPLEQVLLSQNVKASPSLSTSFSELSCGSVSSPALSPSPSQTPTPSVTRQHASTPHTPQHQQHTQTRHQQQHLPLTGACSSAHDSDSLNGPLSAEATATEVQKWLVYQRFSNYTRIFQHFSGADLLRLNRDDLIQICGLADGIRLNNALQSKSVRPRLTIYICQEPESVYHAVYMDCVGVDELKSKLACLFGIQSHQIGDIFMQGPSGIHIMVTDEVLQNTQDQSRFVVEGVREESGDKYRILLKSVE
ncbi:transcription factor CP2-like isoform X2 [Pomacea canaliculata]|uniref:transcription factor CP2-like isoform X2 n=1 Tax=Pomacea canaliculata TaxID=400727 RepID=UPI000D72C0B9|nr:transcription factor CP2-like isoform X2 [Pomacea canaliculata]